MCDLFLHLFCRCLNSDFSFSIQQQVQGIWAQGLDDATCASINHKYRLIAFGRRK